MKIVFDHPPGEDIERHARVLHSAMLNEKNLPRLAGVTRAIVPDWCDDCGERSWGPVLGGVSFCPECRAKRESRNTPGFGA